MARDAKQAVRANSHQLSDAIVDAAIADVGFAALEERQDSQATTAWAPEEAVTEEKRLKSEREAADSQRKPPVERDAGCSDFKALEELLARSEMYSTFLENNLKSSHHVPAVITADGPVAKPAAKAKGKGKKPPAVPKGKGRGTKRTRGEEEGAAAEELPEQPTTSYVPGSQQDVVPLLTASLRDYQLHGIKWLISLYRNGINGILADQMGLGKTIQTIGFISHLVSRGVQGTYMILGPLSTLPNWMNEFDKFCPSVSKMLYHGNRAERGELAKKLASKTDCPKVIVTSYEILMADIKVLQRFKYEYVIVDEGHRLKNMNCRLIRELKTLDVGGRLLLTGTPLQNNLTELWSLLNFVMPKIFANLDLFESWFNFSGIGQEGGDEMVIAAEQRNKVVSKLHSILKPFVLRRVKADVDVALPHKSEILLYCPMSQDQRDINKQLLDKTLMENLARAAAEGGGCPNGAANLKNILMQMRKNCNHPDLITSAFGGELMFPTPDVLVKQCGKLELMDRLLKQLYTRKHKVLIFSQMTKMLDLLESYLEQLGHKACRIDGSMAFQDRQQNITDFNSDPNTWLFLLSTRAGGLGINLTGADTVIIYDSDWNPHQDMQAMDRCHRIGQTKPVLVFRLATAHSVEGKMLKRAEDKLMLERLVIKKGAFRQDHNKAPEDDATVAGSMSATELMELLRPEVGKLDLPQSGVVSDETLALLLDRRHLELSSTAPSAAPYPKSGVGYRVLLGTDSSAMLASVKQDSGAEGSSSKC